MDVVGWLSLVGEAGTERVSKLRIDRSKNERMSGVVVGAARIRGDLRGLGAVHFTEDIERAHSAKGKCHRRKGPLRGSPRGSQKSNSSLGASFLR